MWNRCVKKVSGSKGRCFFASVVWCCLVHATALDVRCTFLTYIFHFWIWGNFPLENVKVILQFTIIPPSSKGWGLYNYSTCAACEHSLRGHMRLWWHPAHSHWAEDKYLRWDKWWTTMTGQVTRVEVQPMEYNDLWTQEWAKSKHRAPDCATERTKILRYCINLHDFVSLERPVQVSKAVWAKNATWHFILRAHISRSGAKSAQLCTRTRRHGMSVVRHSICGNHTNKCIFDHIWISLSSLFFYTCTDMRPLVLGFLDIFEHHALDK